MHTSDHAEISIDPGTGVASVDLRWFGATDPEVRAAAVEAFGHSLVDTGFVRVSGHDISPALIEEAYRCAAQVFALPPAVTARSERPELRGARGFVPFGRERAKSATVVDLKEFWHIGREGGDRDNVWPEQVPEFRVVMTELFTRLERTAELLLEVLARFLGLPERQLADLVVGADPLLRVLHYPAPDDPALRGQDLPGAVRAAAHEDINFLTLLPAATDTGLELADRDGRWVPVDAREGELVVDSGDMLSRYLNGRIPATTHRVVNPTGAGVARYSMPFFCQPRGEVVLTPPAGLLGPGEVLLDEPITAGEFHRQRMEQIRALRD